MFCPTLDLLQFPFCLEELALPHTNPAFPLVDLCTQPAVRQSIHAQVLGQPPTPDQLTTGATAFGPGTSKFLLKSSEQPFMEDCLPPCCWTASSDLAFFSGCSATGGLSVRDHSMPSSTSYDVAGSHSPASTAVQCPAAFTASSALLYIRQFKRHNLAAGLASWGHLSHVSTNMSSISASRLESTALPRTLGLESRRSHPE